METEESSEDLQREGILWFKLNFRCIQSRQKDERKGGLFTKMMEKRETKVEHVWQKL
jgi:hypothetical protein